MKIFVITPFPGIISGALQESILKRAQENGLVEIHLIDLRDYTTDKHRQVDDYPYGGGPGMLLKPEPFFRAVEAIRTGELCSARVTLLCPQGTPYAQPKAREFSVRSDLILLCGHYKGIDERVRQALVDEEISIGDYILTGGELAALVVIDSVVRLLPGALGDFDSAQSDSFEDGHLDCAYYTRPQTYDGMTVPEVLLSGNHAEIAKWRKTNALTRTRARRADLLADACLD